MKAYLNNTNKVILINNKALCYKEPQVIPEDTDFIYFANDYTGTLLPNKVKNTIGDLSVHNTITKNGTGKNTYLDFSSANNNCLYTDLTDDYLNLMKATSNNYTYYFKAYAEGEGDVAGVFSWCQSSYSQYRYMIRLKRGNDIGAVQIDGIGINTTTNFIHNGDIIKVAFKNYDSKPTVVIKNLTTDFEHYAGGISTLRDMTNKFMIGTTRYDGYSSEYGLNYWYGAAGIHRETTETEDEYFKTILKNQSL